MTAVLRLFLHSVWLSLAVAPATAPRAWAEVAAGVSFDAVLALESRAPDGRFRYGNAPAQFAEWWAADSGKPAPVVFFIHGGCWLNQYGADYARPLATALAAAGYAVVNVEYRRVGDPGGGWPGSFEDVRRALAMLAETRPRAMDLDRLVLAGHSAGGHLALLLSAELAAAPPAGFTLRGVLGLAPIVDIQAYSEGDGSCNRAALEFMGSTPAGAPDSWRAANPATRDAHPGTAILLGSDDPIIPYRLPALDGVTVVVEPAGHFDWVYPETAAWQRLLVELGQLTR